jgi:hypothetical protein
VKRMKAAIIITALLLLLSGCGGSQPATPIESAPVAQGTLPPVDRAVSGGVPQEFARFVSSGQRLFYLKNGIVSTDPEGGDKKLILKDDASEIHQIDYTNGWIYYSTDRGIHRITTDGKKNTKVISLDLSTDANMLVQFLADGEWIYYSVYSETQDGSELCRTNGQTEETLLTDYFEGMRLHNGDLYYISMSGRIRKCDLDTKKGEDVTDFEVMKITSITDKNICYQSLDGDVFLYDLATKRTEKLQAIETFAFTVQFHNYVVFEVMEVGEHETISSIVLVDTNTQKAFSTGLRYTDYVDIAMDEDHVYFHCLVDGTIDRLSIENGRLSVDESFLVI